MAYRCFLFAFIAFVGFTAVSSAAEVEQAKKIIERIKAVGIEGNGNQDAAAAWKDLVNLGPDALMPTIIALGEAKPAAENWFRTAVDAIAEKELLAKRPLPKDTLEAFVKSAKNAPVSRRLAFELLAKVDAKSADSLLGGMLDDPSADIRRDAIAQALTKIKKDDANAVKEYTKLFPFTRDQDQAELVAKELAKRGVDVDLTDHFNVIWKWMIVGPFDGPNGSGFNKPYPPEEKVDLAATYTGKGGKQIKWHSFWSFDTYGTVDVNDAIGKFRDTDDKMKHFKDAVAYAFAAVESETERPVELRLGCKIAGELFLNGKRLFAREEYHHGLRLDQYVAKGTLKKGRNEILVKVMQNNQTESWAQDLPFMLRICDATGGKVPFKMLTGE